MKNNILLPMLLFYIFITILIATSFLKTVNIVTNDIEETSNKIDSLTNIVIQMKSTIDTVIVTQAKHFSKCSFIDNESVEIGYDGYLRDKNHRKIHGRGN